MSIDTPPRLWQSPRSAGLVEGRSVSFLELFYDLVYVVIIAELAHLLVGNADLDSFVDFVFLFFLVWWAWFNAAYYHNLHGEDDVRTRVLAFLQMGVLIIMAVTIHDATGGTYRAFTLTYAAFLAILTYLWWDAGIHDPSHRTLTVAIVVPYSVSVVMLMACAFLSGQVRLVAWVIVLLLMVVVPSIIASKGSRWEYMAGLEMTSPSLRERFKLFTIIVLGETVIAVATGISRLGAIDTWSAVVGGSGMILVFGLWWVYFDYSSEHPVKQGRRWFWAWNIVHLPIWMGITMVGPGVLDIILSSGGPLPEGDRWLLAGAMAIILLSMAALLFAMGVPPMRERGYRRGSMILAVAGVLSLLLAVVLPSLTGGQMMFALILILVIPVFHSLRMRKRCMLKEGCEI